MHNDLEHFVLVPRRVRRIAGRHFAEETADRPPVDRLSVGSRRAEHFRRHVIIGSANAVIAHGVVVYWDIGRVRIGSFLLAIVANAEVTKHDVSLAVQENVLWLDVAMDDAARMQVLDGENHLCYVKTSNVLGSDSWRKNTSVKKPLSMMCLKSSPPWQNVVIR